MIDVIPATGEVSDALEVIAYHDRKLNALILEVLPPANDIEYEGGNIGVEPAIISLESGELESAPPSSETSEKRKMGFTS
ncbi:hypothetical protein [Thermococcus sp. JCM 11816]|uniref:hypothetical protein n=1 Tax=Thermococcus sp. (strain JCM 11816 / KS-1) TaxID=1295125 RepID=UPI000AD8505A